MNVLVSGYFFLLGCPYIPTYYTHGKHMPASTFHNNVGIHRSFIQGVNCVECLTEIRFQNTGTEIWFYNQWMSGGQSYTCNKAPSQPANIGNDKNFKDVCCPCQLKTWFGINRYISPNRCGGEWRARSWCPVFISCLGCRGAENIDFIHKLLAAPSVSPMTVPIFHDNV